MAIQTARPVRSMPLDSTDGPPWTLDRLGELTFAVMQALDALTQTAEVQTKLLRNLLEAAGLPGGEQRVQPVEPQPEPDR